MNAIEIEAEAAKALAEAYKEIQQSEIPASAKQAILDEADVQSQNAMVAAFASYPAEKRALHRKRLIRADVAMELMAELEDKLVGVFILDPVGIFGRGLFAKVRLYAHVGKYVFQNAKPLLSAFLAVIIAGYHDVLNLLKILWTQDAQGLIEADDKTIREMGYAVDAFYALVLTIVAVGLHRGLETFALAKYAVTLNSARLARDKVVNAARAAALPQSRHRGGIRRRKVTRR